MALSLWPHLNLVTSQRSHLPILPHWGLRLQHDDFGEDTIQSTGPNKFLKSENVSNENLGQNVGSCFWIFLLSRRWMSQVLGILETLGPHFCLLKSMLLLNAQPFCSMFFFFFFFLWFWKFLEGQNYVDCSAHVNMFPFSMESWSNSNDQITNIFRWCIGVLFSFSNKTSTKLGFYN